MEKGGKKIKNESQLEDGEITTLPKKKKNNNYWNYVIVNKKVVASKVFPSLVCTQSVSAYPPILVSGKKNLQGGELDVSNVWVCVCETCGSHPH